MSFLVFCAVYTTVKSSLCNGFLCSLYNVFKILKFGCNLCLGKNLRV